MVSQEPFQAGDHLRVWRGFYFHHGIYIGNGRVVEFGGDKRNKSAAAVREVALADFDPGGRAEVVSHETPPRLARWMPACLPRPECVARARFLVETAESGRYNLFGQNCEHVATWCATGFPESHQVRIGLWLNALRSACTALAVSWAYRKTARVPAWTVLATVVGAWAVSAYHVHQGRFVREIDRAWRAPLLGEQPLEDL